jgi:hypothetical protein
VNERSRSQWSLRGLLVLLFEIGLFLALVIQLKHRGFILFICLTGMVVGIERRNLRWFSGSVAATLVFVLAYFASWIQVGDGRRIERWNYAVTNAVIHEIHQALLRHHKAHGQFPAALSDLQDSELQGLPEPYGTWREYWLRSSLKDAWDGKIYYRKTADGFDLGSLGKDHELGGTGLDADIFFGQQNDHRLSLSQFLTEVDRYGVVFVPAVIGSIIAGGLLVAPLNEKPVNKKWLVGSVILCVVLAVFVSVQLATIYITIG